MRNINYFAGLSAMLMASFAISAEGESLTATAMATTSVYNPAWQSTEVQAAWNSGYKGQGATITVVDDYSNQTKFSGKLIANTTQTQGHGYWTSEEAGLIAPSATVKQQSWGTSAPVALSTTGLNVINASYGMYASAAYSLSQIRFPGTETSIIADAAGKAVVVKAAGNDAVNVNTKLSNGTIDFLNLALKGGASAIYAGALNKNGTTTAKATIASYSNKAGTDTAVQSHFLMVGVVSSQTGLAGTSFAAPIISGYAGILGSKFKTASATAVTNQLLATARTDTISGYNIAIHGRGEASLTRALAPVSIK